MVEAPTVLLIYKSIKLKERNLRIKLFQLVIYMCMCDISMANNYTQKLADTGLILKKLNNILSRSLPSISVCRHSF